MARRAFTGWGAFAGIRVGVGVVIATTITKVTPASVLPALPDWIQDLNIGLVTPALKIAASLTVSAVERRNPTRISAGAPAE